MANDSNEEVTCFRENNSYQIHKEMERRSLRRRTMRRRTRRQGTHSGDTDGHVAGGQGGGDDQSTSATPSHPPLPGSSSQRRVEMVERIRAEGRKIAPEALTKHHLGENQTQTSGGAEENRSVGNIGAEENQTETNGGSEETPQEEAKNVLASLIKRLSDQTRFELVRSRPE